MHQGATIMAMNNLTDAKIRDAKPVIRASKDKKRPDDRLVERLTKMNDGAGLALWVEPGGAKRWRFAYRFPGRDKNGEPKLLQKMLTLGSYPETSLKEARAARDAARKLLAAGVDPSRNKRATRLARALANANTFSAVAAELVEKKRNGKKSPSTMEKVEWLLGLATPTLGARPIAEITAPEILATLQQIERRGKYNTANRLRALIGEVFRRAVATGRASNDPTVALRDQLTTTKAQPRAAIIEAQDFGGLLLAIDGYRGAPETRLAMQLLALTFVRPGELRAAEWSEFDLDAEQPTWIIPANKMKMKREHKIPLAPQSVAIVRELRVLARGGKYLFPGGRTITRPMSENAMSSALRYMGFSKDEHCPHGFRSSASSMLNAARTPPTNAKGEPQPVRRMWDADAIELQLAHVDSNAVRRVYARDDFWQERCELMAWWADRCDEMRANVGVARAA
jgi:integrase